MSRTARILIGLVLGLISGILISAFGGESLANVPAVVEPIGTLWVNAIRMTVVPLITSLLIIAIASERKSGAVATLGGKTIGLFVVMITSVCVFVGLAAPPLISLLPLDPDTAEALRETTSAATSHDVDLPPFRDWLIELIPTNALQVAVEGAMLPLIVFVVLFAFALTRISHDGREAVLRFSGAIKDAMFVLVEWILWVGPIGVFALILPVAARMGASAAGALGSYLLVACGLITVAMLTLYPFAALVGNVGIGQFARACAPVQAVGFSTRSSLASLPAMFTTAERLKLLPRVSGLVLPVAATTFKFASPIGRTAGTYFVAALYGIALGPVETAVIAGAIGLVSFYSPGIPSGGLIVMTPVYLSFGLPVEGIGLLIALDLIVDMFITAANVTADVTVATVLSHRDGGRG